MESQHPWLQYYDKGVPESIDYPELNLYQLLQMSVEEYPTGVATIFFGAKMRYRRLGKLVDRFAAGLNHLGIGKGDRVALILPNLPGYPIAHFAVLRLGGILVPTNPLYVERELKHQLNDAGVKTIVTLDALYTKVEKVRAETDIEQVVVMSVKDFLPPLLRFLYGLKKKSGFRPNEDEGVYRYADFIKRSYPPHPGSFVAPDDTAMLLYTGGTTGLSKGAVLSHRNVLANAYQTRSWLSTLRDKTEVILCVLPFFHSYGMTTGMHLSVVAQAAMLLLPRFEMPDLVKAIKTYRPTVFCAVPSMYNAINRSPRLTAADVSSIRLCVSGGAALPGAIQSRFESRTGGRLVEGYGLTETSPVALVNPMHGHRKNGTIGIPVSDTEARIVDSATAEPVAAGEVGELAIRGPQVMQKYWKRPEETAKVLINGWLHTGDMGVSDEAGFVRIVDRKKDVIITAGMNVYPREVEEVLLQHPKVVECAVVGVPSSVREEIVKAYLVIEPGQELTKPEVAAFCRDKLSKYKIPKRIELVDELPKSSVGKVLKRVLRDAEQKGQNQE